MLPETNHLKNSAQAHSNRKSTFFAILFSSAALVAVFMAGCKKEEQTSSPLKLATQASTTTTISNNPVPINLRTAANFTILTKTGITTTGTTKIVGDIGASPIASTAITGFGLIMDASNQFSRSSLVTGKIYGAEYAVPTPSKMTTAIGDMQTAFTNANGLKIPAPIVAIYAGDLSGKTLKRGLYKWSTGVLITNAGVTLSGGPNDVWIFQIAQNLTVNNNAKITLIGGAQAKNIFWVVSGKATLGTATKFNGVILSKTLISLNTGADVKGKLLAQTAVTLIANCVHP